MHENDLEANQLNDVTYDEVRDAIIQDPRFGVVNAHCTVSGTNPFGEVFGGTIVIQGGLTIAKYASGSSSATVWYGKE